MGEPTFIQVFFGLGGVLRGQQEARAVGHVPQP